MNSEEFRSKQAPLKAQYKEQPQTALVVLKAEGALGAGISCRVDTGKAVIEAGLHPATGGTGLQACSGNMLLDALVACAGVTLQAVATALGIEIQSGRVRAEGELDFRGTLGVSKEAPVGFKRIRLIIDVATTATEEQKANLLRLTERYCVVLQTLKQSPIVESTLTSSSSV